ncbi:MAG: C4-dicarboxylate ABC transporter permease [Rhodobacteraceae bacterium]|nr:C4-dicarboxylate ABC transporter permease [Paracoccaceae bacterium]MAY44173.1 C4-dicarboxylate ABC transporter permease [Paracoccaceae bacterium]QEW21016.1 TRAP-type C4-dicarboxylate transport system, small permease component [Marinibacterium anthonyi]
MIFDRIETILLGLAAFLLLALMAVTGIDVVGRYLLNAPLSGAFEMTELLLGALVFMALPLVSRHGAHVEVDLLATIVPEPVNKVLGIFAALVSAVMLCWFAWTLVDVMISQIHDGSRSVSLGVPLAPFAALGALACVLAAVFGLIHGVRHD